MPQIKILKKFINVSICTFLVLNQISSFLNNPLSVKATNISSITSKYGWVGNSDIGTKVNFSTQTLGGNFSTNVNGGVQDIYVRPDGNIDLMQASD